MALDLTSITAVVVGVAGLVGLNYASGGALMQVILKAVDFLKEWFSSSIKFIASGFKFFLGFINSIILRFPFDDARKQVMLSIVFIFIVVGLVIVLSPTSWFNGGDVNPQTKNFQIADFSGVSAMGNVQGQGAVNESGNLTTPPLENQSVVVGDCVSDQQCDQLYGEGVNTGLKCCQRDVYNGYSCAGRCLVSSSFGLDACKLPNACFNTDIINKIGWDAYVGDDATRCDNKYGSSVGTPEFTPDHFCQNRDSSSEKVNSLSRCCAVGDETSICRGYCLKADGSHDCNDWTACYSQHEIMPKTISGGDKL